MSTPSHEHDDDLEPTVTDEEIEIEKYDIDEDTSPDAVKDSWTPGGQKPPALDEDHHEDDETDDRL